MQCKGAAIESSAHLHVVCGQEVLEELGHKLRARAGQGEAGHIRKKGGI
jgi:hypothetical protein